MSSAPSSTTSNEAARCAPADVVIGFAEDTDEAAIELHRFLCIIAGPVLHAPINAVDSMNGVIEVLKKGFAVTARADGHLVGSLGIIRPAWWYNRAARFMTDRFFFVLPEFRHHVGGQMLVEAHAIAADAGCPLIINGHQKRRRNGLGFIKPTVLGAGVQPEEA